LLTHFFAAKFWLLQAQRKFFDALATQKNFNPLVKENWFAIAKSEIRSKPVV
jgi:hypothetical protein